jgi:hypothetical protein
MTVSEAQNVLIIINGTDMLEENWDDRFIEVKSTVFELDFLRKAGKVTVAYESPGLLYYYSNFVRQD